MESKKRNMTESMKFGPEWLRSATDNCNTNNTKASSTTSLTAPRYQLAEHRYGREEMLALYDPGYKAPNMLEGFTTLYIEKTQLPLALIQMTEEETRLWNGGITSASGRGRGGSVDRGGRGGRGRGGLFTHSRGAGFDDSGEGSRLEAQAFSQTRGRPFERSQSERSWSDRNGVSDSGDWNGSTSPRKESGRGVSGSSLMENNWRRQRGGAEEEEGWRTMSNPRGEKWGGRTNWREAGSDRDRGDGDTEETRSGSRWEHRGSHRSNYDSSHHSPHRTGKPWDSNHHDNHDNLPEWVTENPSESGGSFDALGAFHGGMYSDDEEDNQEVRSRRSSEGTSGPVKSQSAPKMFNYGTTGGATAASMSRRARARLRDLNLRSTSQEDQDSNSEPSPTKPTKPLKPSPSNPSLKSPTTKPKLAKGKVPEEEVKSVKEPASKMASKVGSKVAPPKTTEKVEEKLIAESPCQRIIQELKDIELEPSPPSQKAEFPLDRMKEEADALVAKLMADEITSHKDVVPPTVAPSAIDTTQEKWFYRDPQGKVQGPFSAAEMAEWCKQGYFNANLMIRRTCDERYTTLGELITMCGRVPFKPGPPIPPLKATEPMIPGVTNPVAGAMPTANAINKPGVDNTLLLLQQQRMQQLQQMQLHIQNQMLLGPIRNMLKHELSQSLTDWSSLSPIEQTQLISQYMAANQQHSEFPDIPVHAAPFVTPPITTPPTNPVIQLINQMQGKTQPDNHVPTSPLPAVHQPTPPMDPLQQLIAGAPAMASMPTMPPTNLSVSPQDDNPIKMLIRQLSNANNHPPPMSLDSVWPQPPPPHVAAQFPTQNWIPPVGPISAIPPGQIPSSLWDVHCKDIEREQQQQHLDKQNSEAQEAKRKEELKKLDEMKEEIKRKAEEEFEKKKREEEQMKIAEENKRKKEEEKKRKEEEKRRLEEEQRKKEEKKKKEEERKKEEKRKQEEEALRKKQEEERKKKEELRKQEEKRKEEEKRKKLEEQQRLEAERIKNEEALRKKAELEEQNRKSEQRRREAEALRKLQERSKAPWAQATHTSPATTHASLSEIQRLEREKKAEEQRLQQLFQQQAAQQKAAEMAQEAAAMDSSKKLQFKWAEKANSSERFLPVKSLAQIQQEEQERIAKVKQQEKEKQQERAAQKETVVGVQNTGIWGTASQTLNWNSSSGSANQAWGSASSAGGFWEDATVPKNSQPSKNATKQTPVKVQTNTNQQASVVQQNSKANKNKSKKEEELVKKLFEQNTAKTDDFTQWCNKALAGLQVSVDIPTFVGFLRDIESAYEVKEYVRLYLGDGRQCVDFAKQFLEKRSKWRSAQRPQVQADDLCKPAPAVNPNACTEFQEVKGKSKKPKKGKMFKVDNRILGFSVTSAPDRINVGDRDYGEGM